MEWLDNCKKTFGINNPFLYKINREQAGEILLKYHKTERQLVEEAIDLWANDYNRNKIEAQTTLPLIFHYESNMLIDGATKLAGFIKSDLVECEFLFLFIENETL